MVRSPKKHWLKWLLGGCLGLSLFGGVAGAGFVWLASRLSPSLQINDFTPQELENWLGLEFPEHINEIRSHRDGWLGSQVFVRLHVPGNSIPKFVERNGWVRTEASVDQLELPQPAQVQDLHWWRLEAELEQAKGEEKVYHMPSSANGQHGRWAGATEQGFYFPTIVVIPTEKNYVWLYLYGLNL